MVRLGHCRAERGSQRIPDQVSIRSARLGASSRRGTPTAEAEQVEHGLADEDVGVPAGVNAGPDQAADVSSGTRGP